MTPRRLVASLAAAILLAVPTVASAQIGEPAPPPASPGFYPADYIGADDAFNCKDFISQADAQAVLRADPTDPNQLDTDRPSPDGVACESNRAPFDRVAVPR